VKKKPRVLASAYAFNPEGGPHLHPGEDIVGWRLVEQLSRFYYVWVITHSCNKPAVESYKKKGALPGVIIEYVRLPFNLRRIFYKLEIGQRVYYYIWQILAWRKARILHKRVGFDAAQHITFNNDWIPSFIGAWLPVPFIWGPVGGGQRTPPAFYSGYKKRGRAADKVRLFGQWIGRNVLVSRRLCVRNARAILVCNNETRDKMPPHVSPKVHFFPVNGIAEEDVSGPNGRNSGEFRVLSVGRMIHWKNFSSGIEAFGMFHERHKGSRLTMIGYGPQREKLEALAEELGLEDSIKFVDWMARQDLFDVMRASDVFLHPALREGGGAVVVEAMACGLPVVGLDNAGPGMHIRGGWGIKIKPQSPSQIISEMTEALEKLHNDRALRLRMGEAALQRARSFYVWDRQGERLHGIIEGILAEDGAKA